MQLLNFTSLTNYCELLLPNKASKMLASKGWKLESQVHLLICVILLLEKNNYSKAVRTKLRVKMSDSQIDKSKEALIIEYSTISRLLGDILVLILNSSPII